MPLSASWHTLLEELDELPDDAEPVTPLLHDTFHITDVQEHCAVVMLNDTGEYYPLRRDQFRTPHHRIQDSNGAFELDRLPPGADSYPAMLNLRPWFEVDEEQGSIAETEAETGTQLLNGESAPAENDRVEPNGIDVYPDTLPLIGVLKRWGVSDLTTLKTEVLANLYILYSGVQRNVDGLRQDIADVLLNWLHHGWPVHGQYGSAQRTLRHSRSLKDEENVLAILEGAGIDRGRAMSADSKKVNEVLEVTELSETDVYEVDESEHARKTEADEDVRELRFRGLKDRLATSSDTESDELRQEIEVLEERIDDLTSLGTGAQMQG